MSTNCLLLLKGNIDCLLGLTCQFAVLTPDILNIEPIFVSDCPITANETLSSGRLIARNLLSDISGSCWKWFSGGVAMLQGCQCGGSGYVHAPELGDPAR